MGVIDLTEDTGVQMQLASQIGGGIANTINSVQRRRRLAEQKEKRQLTQAETIRILDSGLKGQELLGALNEIPGSVDNRLTQNLNERELIRRTAPQPTVDQDVAELRRITESMQKLYKWDGVQSQHILIPGGEELKLGLDQARKNVVERLIDKQRAQNIGVEDIALRARKQLDVGQDVSSPEAVQDFQPQTPLAAETAQVESTLAAGLEGLPQDQKRTFLDDTISTENAIASIKDQAAEYEQSGMSRQDAQKQAFQDYSDLKAEDTGSFQKFPDIDEAEIFDDIVAQAAANVRASLPRPTTQSEFDAIPTGASFIDTDGKEKRKK